MAPTIGRLGAMRNGGVNGCEANQYTAAQQLNGLLCFIGREKQAHRRVVPQLGARILGVVSGHGNRTRSSGHGTEALWESPRVKVLSWWPTAMAPYWEGHLIALVSEKRRGRVVAWMPQPKQIDAPTIGHPMRSTGAYGTHMDASHAKAWGLPTVSWLQPRRLLAALRGGGAHCLLGGSASGAKPPP